MVQITRAHPSDPKRLGPSAQTSQLLPPWMHTAQTGWSVRGRACQAGHHIRRTNTSPRARFDAQELNATETQPNVSKSPTLAQQVGRLTRLGPAPRAADTCPVVAQSWGQPEAAYRLHPTARIVGLVTVALPAFR